MCAFALSLEVALLLVLVEIAGQRAVSMSMG